MLAGRIERAMVIAKGSLFLGKMTHLSDGMSFVLEAS
jgi:betaine reductase